MIPTHSADRTRLAFTYNGLTLNDPDDDKDDTFEINTIAPGALFDQTFDSDPAGDGTEVGNVRRTALMLRIDGTLRAPTYGRYFDKRVALAEAFDPALAAYKNAAASGITPASWGVLPLDFSVPTLDTANYATGLVPSRYYARSRGGVYIPTSQYSGLAGFFSIEMIVPDAVRYLQTTSSLNGAGTLDNALADAPSAATVTITMAGAGAINYTITRTGTYSTKALVLDLSGLASSDVVTVDMKRKRIWVDSTETPGLYVSGDYFDVEPNSQTISIANATNATTVTSWRRAWVA